MIRRRFVVKGEAAHRFVGMVAPPPTTPPRRKRGTLTHADPSIYIEQSVVVTQSSVAPGGPLTAKHYRR